ncbi:hypothetical protein HZS61_002193 [Fusarium oxysporum f. sp. conglutinans]|uniref:Uncharacterized protein n=1 Tax=Fusarium oxysporum f. sp. conglutinans TaxID=100902 RepID=A0A8H6GBP2_FUSOX|nr:hypothetical protein HZS61_006114 [Fusarium oxysporum f. sp. conglutinans]KAF6515022.1 hypothetical protein HZS61_006156 [Fusarium oxysporum f. sp. conglutinans]KAF6518115.1 hypothetical protein HZS61_002193 [Fusarium oxysporum f. sp. conglutinans]KAG6978214.1 hypothetical protein FocnCong_v021724 [Fusarium oxysporum f. sp. conglutinans]KAG7000281.1 hypothetical protein FocnCong_v012396 [Fusarium oxysporum f. sp. conglutinans]
MLLKSLLLPLALLQATSALSINSPQEDASDKHQLQARSETIDVPFSCLGSQSPGICFTVAAVGVTLYKVGNHLHYHAVHTINPQARGFVNFVFANGRVPVEYGPGINGLAGKIWVDSRMGPGVKLQK